MSFDVVIIGSGPAGVAAAEALKGARAAILDVGIEQQEVGLEGSMYETREACADLTEQLLGREYESLQNIFGPPLNVKLKSPAMRYVTRDSSELSPVKTSDFTAVMSFARGGLANAWGGGVHRSTPDELASFPFDPDDLTRYYDHLACLMGISGLDDDLSPFFGSAAGLDPPLEIDQLARFFLGGYERNRRAFNERGIFVGRTRAAIITRDRDGRPAYPYAGSDFFQPKIPAIYNPSETLASLVRDGSVEYLPRRLALRFQESEEGVVVHARNLRNGTRDEIRCRKLILAAGTLNSAKLVLSSNDDHHSRLPILDNPISYIPLLVPRRIGKSQERRFFGGGQLNLVYRGEAADDLVLGTFYGMSSVLRSDFLMDIPLSASSIIGGARHLAPALAVAQLFYSDRPNEANYVRRTESEALEIHHVPNRLGVVERILIRALRRLGCFGAARLCQYPPPGSSIHYAGTLPMKERPERPYETGPDGLLFGSQNVYVCDASTFPRLSAKGPTFTAMANSMRIADRVAASLRA